AQHRAVAFEWRPCKACARRKITLMSDTLILVAHAQIKTQVGSHHPAILPEAHVLSITATNPTQRIEDDSFSERSIGAGDVDGSRGELHSIAGAVVVKSDFDLVRTREEVERRRRVNLQKLYTLRMPILRCEVVPLLN